MSLPVTPCLAAMELTISMVISPSSESHSALAAKFFPDLSDILMAIHPMPDSLVTLIQS